MAFNILVVDDSMLARAFMLKALKLSGIAIQELYQAANGAEALKVLTDEWVDIVFADINMPEMNGIEMVRRMSNNTLLKNVPVIIVSTERSEKRMEELKKVGVKAYISKPFTPEELKRIVEDIFSVQ